MNDETPLPRITPLPDPDQNGLTVYLFAVLGCVLIVLAGLGHVGGVLSADVAIVVGVVGAFMVVWSGMILAVDTTVRACKPATAGGPPPTPAPELVACVDWETWDDTPVLKVDAAWGITAAPTPEAAAVLFAGMIAAGSPRRPAGAVDSVRVAVRERAKAGAALADGGATYVYDAWRTEAGGEFTVRLTSIRET